MKKALPFLILTGLLLTGCYTFSGPCTFYQQASLFAAQFPTGPLKTPTVAPTPSQTPSKP